MRIGSPLRTAARSLPWQWRAAVGLIAVAIGMPLVIHPLESLDALTVYLAACFVVASVVEWNRGPRTRTRLLIVAAWLIAAFVLLIWPSRTIGDLPDVIAAILIGIGVGTIVGARAGALDARLSGAVMGAVGVVLGLIVLQWHDVTLIIVAALFGVYLLGSGAALLGEALLHRDRPEGAMESAGSPGLLRRWSRVIGALLALAASVVVLVVGTAVKRHVPRIDDFYTAPASVTTAPGQLLRSDPFTREVPAGAAAWRILYTTTDANGRSTVASALVVVPTGSGAPHPVIAWAHGTTGYAQDCAPTLLAKPFTAGAFPAVFPQVIQHGWAVVATDYAGLGTAGPEPYVIGKGEAYSVLDAVRAARHLEPAHLSPTKTVVWGHSQGGGAALWTDQVQPSYATDVPLNGTIAMAPAADPLSLARDLKKILGGSVFGAFVAMAYAETYPDLPLKDFVKPAAIPIVRQLASRCLAEPGVYVSLLTALALKNETLLKGDPGSGAIGQRLRENIPTDPGPGPLYVVQGTADSIIDPAVVRAYVAQLRADGHVLTYRTYPGLNHMPLVQKGSALLPDLIAWTQRMFDK